MFFKKRPEEPKYMPLDVERVIKAAAVVAVYWGARKAVQPESLDDLIHALNIFHKQNPEFFDAGPSVQTRDPNKILG